MENINKAILEAYGEEELKEALENDCMDYALYPVKNDSDLGYYILSNWGIENFSKEMLMRYFDYEKFGHDYTIEADGDYTSEGFVEKLI